MFFFKIWCNFLNCKTIITTRIWITPFPKWTNNRQTKHCHKYKDRMKAQQIKYLPKVSYRVNICMLSLSFSFLPVRLYYTTCYNFGFQMDSKITERGRDLLVICTSVTFIRRSLLMCKYADIYLGLGEWIKMGTIFLFCNILFVFV